MPKPIPIYRPRKPQDSQYYQCVEDHFESLEQVYEDRFSRQYGFWRNYVRQVIYRYLDCGILHNGFARIRRDNFSFFIFFLPFASALRHISV